MHTAVNKFTIGKALTLRSGADLALISTGGMLHETMVAGNLLSKLGIEATVISMHTLKPLDENAIVAAAESCGAIFTIEEHSVIGGLGAAVSEVLMESAIRPRIFSRIGLEGVFSIVGDQEFLRKHYGLDGDSIASRVKDELRKAV